jgi:16S rRNA (guanine527-N7)-methyltransferase
MEEIVREVKILLDVQLNAWQVSALEAYEGELLTWNQRHNLTAIRDPEKVRIKHFLDSLSAYKVMQGTRIERVVDVGTGAGFPGLPLKILCPRVRLTLVESVGKKAAFCQHIVEKLSLEGVQVIRSRAESVGKQAEHREQYDWALARAVAVMPVLMEYLLPLVRVGGQALAMKGDRGPAETQSAERAIQLLGGHLRQVMPVMLPGVVEERYLVVVDKVATTPEKYPRRVGIPSKRPL